MEGAAEEGAGPCEGEDTETGMVETGGEIGVAGNGRRFRRWEVVRCGRGWWSEA